MSRELSVGIVGATGLVGETFRKLLADSKYKFKELRLFASERSKGMDIPFRDTSFKVRILEENCFEGLDVVFFSSGDPISKEWAPKAAAQGAIAVDNSAAYRMDPNTPLVVPEINFDQMGDPLKPRVIANPNCSTIQLVMVLNALKPFGISDVRVSSYQSVSGAGKEGISDLIAQSKNVLNDQEPGEGQTFNPPIAFECQPKIGSYNDDGFCSEEVKIMNETKKILSLPDLRISAFTVRVPTLNGHGEAVWVTFDKEVSKEQIESTLSECSYINYMKPTADKSFHSYKEVSGESDAYVSRLRKDVDFPNTWMMWVVADNLYRGAASNGLLIAERIFDKLQ
ncbi:MAG: aspartate-semialdehyde dehydrogenase [Bdellovibrionales bacterium]|nr:aspartate-semialdehyde dehydrogenase [Bdellovibrionales bacterium]NQZ18272.1 aspartate-semialdehyde dehydrogenase [Bdellovibrionales bacterium]